MNLLLSGLPDNMPLVNPGCTATWATRYPRVKQVPSNLGTQKRNVPSNLGHPARRVVHGQAEATKSVPPSGLGDRADLQGGRQPTPGRSLTRHAVDRAH